MSAVVSLGLSSNQPFFIPGFEIQGIGSKECIVYVQGFRQLAGLLVDIAQHGGETIIGRE